MQWLFYQSSDCSIKVFRSLHKNQTYLPPVSSDRVQFEDTEHIIYKFNSYALFLEIATLWIIFSLLMSENIVS